MVFVRDKDRYSYYQSNSNHNIYKPFNAIKLIWPDCIVYYICRQQHLYMTPRKISYTLLSFLADPRFYLFIGGIITLVLPVQHPGFLLLGVSVVSLSLLFWLAKSWMLHIARLKQDSQLDEDFIP